MKQVYTCGAAYVHAEARKAPTVDGKVIRQGAQMGCECMGLLSLKCLKASQIRHGAGKKSLKACFAIRLTEVFKDTTRYSADSSCLLGGFWCGSTLFPRTGDCERALCARINCP